MSGNPLPSSFDGNTDFYEENNWQKLSRRLKEEPLIPFGCALTVAALIGATRSIRSGDHNQVNRMFRARIMAQAFTLVAMVAGSIYWDADRKKRKEFEGAVSERKAKEKNEAWIRELEARDQEEKELQALREKRTRRAAGEKIGKVEKKIEGAVEKVEEEGKGIMARVGGIFGGGKETGKEAGKEAGKESGKGEPKPPTANSMVEDCERRTKGILWMVQDLANSRK